MLLYLVTNNCFCAYIPQQNYIILDLYNIIKKYTHAITDSPHWRNPEKSLLGHATPLPWREVCHVCSSVSLPSIRDFLRLPKSPPAVSLRNPLDQTETKDKQNQQVSLIENKEIFFKSIHTLSKSIRHFCNIVKGKIYILVIIFKVTPVNIICVYNHCRYFGDR